MAFNADSYRRNQYLRDAWARLEKARELRAAGDLERAATYAFLARNGMRLFRSQRTICRINAEMRRA